jgi:hypothetical protein
MTSVGVWKSTKLQLDSTAFVHSIPAPASAISEQISRALASTKGNLFTMSTGASPRVAAPSLPECLFDALVGFKMKTSRLASAHFTKPERDKLFKQLDSLFDIESWDSSDAIASEASFVTLLRMVLFLGGRRPALGLTSTGYFIASWTEGNDRLTIECKPNDQVRLVFSHLVEDQRETIASETNSVRLPIILAPYESPNRWFVNAINKASA